MNSLLIKIMDFSDQKREGTDLLSDTSHQLWLYNWILSLYNPIVTSSDLPRLGRSHFEYCRALIFIFPNSALRNLCLCWRNNFYPQRFWGYILLKSTHQYQGIFWGTGLSVLLKCWKAPDMFLVHDNQHPLKRFLGTGWHLGPASDYDLLCVVWM